MQKIITFRAVIVDPGGGGAFVRIPFDVEQTFGKKRVPVLATIDGKAYRGTLVRMGEPFHILIILKEIRQTIGKTFGDEVEITLQEDESPRIVEVPEDLQHALRQEPRVQAAFEKLSYSHRKEHITVILEAKRSETRQARIARLIRILKDKK